MQRCLNGKLALYCGMKFVITPICLILFLVSFSRLHAQSRNLSSGGSLYFIENKGQVKDQDLAPRNDIQYVLHAAGITVFIGNGQLHYQFIQGAGTRGNILKVPADLPANMVPDLHAPFFNVCRMDVALLNTNQDVQVTATEEQQYYENYYLPGCQPGARAHTFKKITYKNIYPGIDWVLKINNNKLEHEFVVAAGADPSKIRLQYSGQKGLQVNKDGTITAVTEMGTIREQAPLCYKGDGSKIAVAYKLNDNVLSYAIDAKEQDGFIIDPTVEWGTYYGPDSNTTSGYGVGCDDSANVYSCGLTWAATDIATVGSFLTTIVMGTTDAYLVKLDSSGIRLWATYYGGSGNDWSKGVACDTAGNVYMCGITSSPAGIATSGAQQTAYAGGLDDFIVKFDGSGSRVWGTYVGGRADEYATSVSCDHAGHVYIAGTTDNTSGISTVTGFKPVKGRGHESYLIQFDNSTGLRTWGTYYGGDGDDYGGGTCTDAANNVYFCGFTSSDTGVASPASWQTFLSGGTDAFLVKFNVSGARVWGTFYGGEGSETAGAVAVDRYGTPTLFGSTSSDTGMTTPGCFQSVRGGLNDAFLVQFEATTGHRSWGTYLGGPDAEEESSVNTIATDYSGNIYVTGYTRSLSGLASAGALQGTYGGGSDDAFFAKFDVSGAQIWSTYYGGINVDEGRGVAYDGKYVYLVGQTNSPNNIATPGGFLPIGGSGGYYYQEFLVKFNIIEPCTLGPISGPAYVCLGDTAAFTNSTAGGRWSSSNTMIASVGSISGIVTGITPGSFIVTYSSLSVPGCFVTLQDTVTVCPSGVHSVSSSDDGVEVFPNPATLTLTVNTSSSGYSAAEIFNPQGQLMYRGTLPRRMNEIGIKNLPPGVYYLKLSNGSDFIVRKFIKR
jgi:hypothetical protein